MTEKRKPGRPRVLTNDLLGRIVILTSEPPPPARWTVRKLAAELGVSPSTVQAALKSLRTSEPQ